MSSTARLLLPYIAPQQAQKQVTYNTAMAQLDQLVQPSVKSRTTTTPPGSAAEGDTYIVAPASTGAWAGKDNKLAAWLGGAWSFTIPADGWMAFVTDTAELAVLQAGAWTSFVTNGGTALAKLGINATADLTNRLAVGADASLFTHAGTAHRMKLNKASAADTASTLYQDNFSSRAEIGLLGDDAFHVKVSPNGSSWFEAINIAQASGLVTLPIGQLAFPATQNPSAGANVLDDYEEGIWTPTILIAGAATGITYTTQLGRYTKIGRMVIASGNVQLSNKGALSGTVQIGGLPFNSLNDGIYSAAAVGSATGFSSVVGAVILLVQPNSLRLNCYQSANGASTALTNGNLTNTSLVYFTVCYEGV